MDATSLVILVSLIFFTSGVIIGWLVARYYYLQTSEELEHASAELKEEAAKIRIYNVMTLKALEEVGAVELDWDDSGKVMGLKRIIKPAAEQEDVKSAPLEIPFHPPVIENDNLPERVINPTGSLENSHPDKAGDTTPPLIIGDDDFGEEL